MTRLDSALPGAGDPPTGELFRDRETSKVKVNTSCAVQYNASGIRNEKMLFVH